MAIIKYNRIVKSIAMSKSPSQSGLSLAYKHSYSEDVVVIESINPRMNDITSHLRMEIPIEHIDDVIRALEEIKTDFNKNK